MTIYLYIKQCTHCGLKYFGKTTKDPLKYLGSGTKWIEHYNAHGRENIITLTILQFTNQEECTDFALKFSMYNDIVISEEWANLKWENGIDGGTPGHSPETIAKIVAANKGRVLSPEALARQTAHLKVKETHPMYGRKHSEESKRKNSESNKGKRHGPPSEETRKKISAVHKGKIVSEETRKKQSLNALNRTEEHKQKLRLSRVGMKYVKRGQGLTP